MTPPLPLESLTKALECAERATPGKWRKIWRRGNRIVTERCRFGELHEDLIARVSGFSADAAHIATMHPEFAKQVLRELIWAKGMLEMAYTRTMQEKRLTNGWVLEYEKGIR